MFRALRKNQRQHRHQLQFWQRNASKQTPSLPLPPKEFCLYEGKDFGEIIDAGLEREGLTLKIPAHSGKQKDKELKQVELSEWGYGIVFKKYDDIGESPHTITQGDKKIPFLVCGLVSEAQHGSFARLVEAIQSTERYFGETPGEIRILFPYHDDQRTHINCCSLKILIGSDGKLEKDMELHIYESLEMANDSLKDKIKSDLKTALPQKISIIAKTIITNVQKDTGPSACGPISIEYLFALLNGASQMPRLPNEPELRQNHCNLTGSLRYLDKEGSRREKRGGKKRKLSRKELRQFQQSIETLGETDKSELMVTLYLAAKAHKLSGWEFTTELNKQYGLKKPDLEHPSAQPKIEQFIAYCKEQKIPEKIINTMLSTQDNSEIQALADDDTIDIPCKIQSLLAREIINHGGEALTSFTYKLINLVFKEKFLNVVLREQNNRETLALANDNSQTYTTKLEKFLAYIKITIDVEVSENFAEKLFRTFEKNQKCVFYFLLFDSCGKYKDDARDKLPALSQKVTGEPAEEEKCSEEIISSLAHRVSYKFLTGFHLDPAKTAQQHFKRAVTQCARTLNNDMGSTNLYANNQTDQNCGLIMLLVSDDAQLTKGNFKVLDEAIAELNRLYPQFEISIPTGEADKLEYYKEYKQKLEDASELPGGFLTCLALFYFKNLLLRQETILHKVRSENGTSLFNLLIDPSTSNLRTYVLQLIISLDENLRQQNVQKTFHGRQQQSLPQTPAPRTSSEILGSISADFPGFGWS
ncbi:MAG: hypothetical protein V3V61_03780 [Gammaproteobacteria bacterium]